MRCPNSTSCARPYHASPLTAHTALWQHSASLRTRQNDDRQWMGEFAAHQERLMSTPIFLCGPITCAIEDGRFDLTVQSLLESIALRLESADFSILSAHREESFGQNIPSKSEDVFRRDWHLAQLSTAMVVVLPSDRGGRLFRTDGTFIELGWAVALRKPLFVVTDPVATGRSYMLDGLLRVSACAAVFSVAEALDGERLALSIRRYLSMRPATWAAQVGFFCPAFRFGPASTLVAIAETLRELRPAYRLVFVGSNASERYARASSVFDEVRSADVDSEPELAVSQTKDCHAVVNALNFGILSHWSRQQPPQFFLDSVAWRSSPVSDAARLAHTYFVQDLSHCREDPVPADIGVRIPPVVSPSVRVPRASWEVEEGYLLVNVTGHPDPDLPANHEDAYASHFAACLSEMLQRAHRERPGFIRRVLLCGNEAILQKMQLLPSADSSVPMERRFLPPRRFLLELRRCALLLTTPGTAALQALALDVPVHLLPAWTANQRQLLNCFRLRGFIDERGTGLSLPAKPAGGPNVEGLVYAHAESMRRVVAAAVQRLVGEDQAAHSSLLRQRMVAWDGGAIVAQHIVHTVEAQRRDGVAQQCVPT